MRRLFYIFNDAQYDARSGGASFSYEDFKFPEWGRWPNPKAMVAYLHENGLKCMLWQNSNHQADHELASSAKTNWMHVHFYGIWLWRFKIQMTHPTRLQKGWFKDSLLMDFFKPVR